VSSNALATCVACKRTFVKKHPLHKYCHWQCQAAANKARRDNSAQPLIQREQEVSSLASSQPIEELELVSQRIDRPARCPRGRYVYAWYSSDSDLPFYIGKGVGDRGWRRHVSKGSRLAAWCQTLRASSERFRVEVVRDNLTNEGAMLLESALIAFVASLGGILANQVDPLRRQECPPLEIEVSE
jgi:hypothetical protein